MEARFGDLLYTYLQILRLNANGKFYRCVFSFIIGVILKGPVCDFLYQAFVSIEELALVFPIKTFD